MPMRGARKSRAAALSCSACTPATGASPRSRRFWKKTALAGSSVRNGTIETKNEKGNEKGIEMAVEVETGRFTVGVFQDIAWAEKGVDALRKQGLAVESLSILGKASPEMAAFIERTLGAPQSLDVHDLGPVMARGPLVPALQGSDQGLAKSGIAGTMRRV